MLNRLHLVIRAFYLLLPLQFRVLYQVFLMRVVDLELLSTNSDTTKLVGQFASILGSFSFLISVPYIIYGLPHLPPPISWTFEHFLIATTMVVVGLFSVLTWDSIFPDRRDVLVLAPLPVRPRTIFLAKISALLVSIGLIVFALNAITGVAFPIMLFRVTPTTPIDLNRGALIILRHAAAYWGYGIRDILHGLAAYWITFTAAAVFLFCSVITMQGFAAQLLPRQLFLRLSAFLQVVLFCLILGTYFLEPSLESPRALAAHENQHFLSCLPTYWFFGLFNQLNGTMHPAMVSLAHRAWLALATSLLGAGAVVLNAYFRVMRKVVEEPDILPTARSLRWTPVFGSSLKTAIMLFSTRAVLRSRHHRVLLSFYFGVGLAMVLAYISTPLSKRKLASANSLTQIEGGFLIASILLLFLAIIGLRIVSTIPINLRANWIFRVTQTRKLRDHLHAIRLSWFLLGVLPVWLLATALLSLVAPWRPVLQHSLVLALLGVILVELCLNTYRKIPFTCSYLPGKGKMHLSFWVFLAFFLPMLDRVTKYEQQIFSHPYQYAAMILILAAIIIGARCVTNLRTGPDDDLIFEEEESLDLVPLKLI